MLQDNVSQGVLKQLILKIFQQKSSKNKKISPKIMTGMYGSSFFSDIN